jgi:hypothetical protein
VKLSDLGWRWSRTEGGNHSGHFTMSSVYEYYEVLLFIDDKYLKGIFITFK